MQPADPCRHGGLPMRHLNTVLILFPLLSVATGADSNATSSATEGRERSILDQYNTDTLNSTLNGGASPYEWQQGVTAGITGQLTRIALYVVIDPQYGATATTEVSVSLGAPWQSGAPAWMTVRAPVRSGWNTFNVSKAKIFLTAGDHYVIGIHGQSAYNFNPAFGVSYGNQYSGGELFLNGTTAGSEGNDLLFRTYVTGR
jgi:hypothetical protein